MYWIHLKLQNNFHYYGWEYGDIDNYSSSYSIHASFPGLMGQGFSVIIFKQQAGQLVEGEKHVTYDLNLQCFLQACSMIEKNAIVVLFLWIVLSCEILMDYNMSDISYCKIIYIVLGFKSVIFNFFKHV